MPKKRRKKTVDKFLNRLLKSVTNFEAKPGERCCFKNIPVSVSAGGATPAEITLNTTVFSVFYFQNKKNTIFIFLK